jgi:hypothetical protein
VIPPLPSGTIEWWISEYDCSPTMWQGQRLGLTLPAVGSPAVAADPGLFNGRVVAKSASATTSLWRGSGLAGLPALGSRPWVFAVARLRDITVATAEALAALGTTANPNTEAGIAALPATFLLQTISPAVGNLAGSLLDTAVHRFKGWKDGILKNFQIDGSLFTVGDTSAVVANTDAVGIGGFHSAGSVFPSDASVAFYLICSAKPTAAEESALDTWAQSYYAMPPQKPPPPAAAVAAWHSELSCASSAWIDYMGGKSLPGVNAPLVGIDPGLFNGRLVGRSTAGGVQYWRGTPLAALAALGTRPWMMLVARMRTTTGGVMCGFGQDGVNDEMRLNASATNFLASGPSGVVTGPPIDTALHRFKCWRDGTNRNLKVDETLFSVPDATAVTLPTTAVGLGGPSNATVATSDCSIAFMMVCSAKPSAAEEAALDAWSRAYWGTL